MFLKFFCLIFSIITLVGVHGTNKMEPLADNVILIIADDIGMEYFKLFKFAFEKSSVDKFPKTPVLDKLAKNGILFPNFYTNPTCSATRVSILTGRYGFRTGVGCPAGLNNSPGIAETEMTIPKALAESNINSVIFGKWHISTAEDGYDMPMKMGFNIYRGIFEGGVDSYEKWELSENGSKPKETMTYVTEMITDHAIEFLKANQTKPFFLWLAHYAPHVPLHRPPKRLLYSSEYKELDKVNPLIKGIDPIPYLYAMVESLDYEIGRLLDALKDDVRKKTTIIFISDNGNLGDIIEYDDKNPYDSKKVKETVYEGGVRMPLIISGAGVKDPNRINTDLVNSVDLYSTIGEVLGVDMEDDSLWDVVLQMLRIKKKNYIDSISLVEVMQDKKATNGRDFALCEQFGNCKNDDFDIKEQRSIRNFEYKYIYHMEDKKEELYYLMDDPYEKNNLLTSKGKVKDSLKKYFKEYTEENLVELKEMLEELLDTEE